MNWRSGEVLTVTAKSARPKTESAYTTRMLYLLEIEHKRLAYRYPARDFRLTDIQCQFVSYRLKEDYGS